jgi:hypothetical protein
MAKKRKKSWQSLLPRDEIELAAADAKLAKIAKRYQIQPNHRSYYRLLALCLAAEYAPEFRRTGAPTKWDQSAELGLYVAVANEMESGAKSALKACTKIAKREPWVSLLKQTEREWGQSTAEYLRQRFQRVKAGLGTWRDVVAQNAAREGVPYAEAIRGLPADDDTVDLFLEIDHSSGQVRRHVILRKERRRPR